jgi:hypothetical protein
MMPEFKFSRLLKRICFVSIPISPIREMCRCATVHICKCANLHVRSNSGYDHNLTQKVKITKRALVLRIRRRLLKQKQTLTADFRGAYRRIDLAANHVMAENVNLLALAKELKCLRPWGRGQLNVGRRGSVALGILIYLRPAGTNIWNVDLHTLVCGHRCNG